MKILASLLQSNLNNVSQSGHCDGETKETVQHHCKAKTGSTCVAFVAERNQTDREIQIMVMLNSRKSEKLNRKADFENAH